jgi:3-phenylpropionate/cinnamic acid dioxygenase small subunit
MSQWVGPIEHAPLLPRDIQYYETKREIEEFLYDEANLLDNRQFNAWLGILAEDLEYYIVSMKYSAKSSRSHSRNLAARDSKAAGFNADKWTLSEHVERILTETVGTDEPTDPTCRIVSNVQLTAMRSNNQTELEVDTASRFLICQTLDSQEQLFIGARRDRIRRTDFGWRLCRREVLLNQNTLLTKNLNIFF